MKSRSWLRLVFGLLATLALGACGPYPLLAQVPPAATATVGVPNDTAVTATPTTIASSPDS